MKVACPEGLSQLLVPIDEIRPNPKNPRIKHDVEAISESLKRFGWHSALVALRDGELLIGHGRLAAARRLGLSEVPVIRVDDDRPQALARMVSDNRLGELSEWDFAELEELVSEIKVDDFDLDGLHIEEMIKVPDFSAVDEDDLADLDKPTLHTCPSCGYEW